jgi:hypothetical protein
MLCVEQSLYVLCFCRNKNLAVHVRVICLCMLYHYIVQLFLFSHLLYFICGYYMQCSVNPLLLLLLLLLLFIYLFIPVLLRVSPLLSEVCPSDNMFSHLLFFIV